MIKQKKKAEYVRRANAGVLNIITGVFVGTRPQVSDHCTDDTQYKLLCYTGFIQKFHKIHVSSVHSVIQFSQSKPITKKWEFCFSVFSKNQKNVFFSIFCLMGKIKQVGKQKQRRTWQWRKFSRVSQVVFLSECYKMKEAWCPFRMTQ